MISSLRETSASNPAIRCLNSLVGDNRHGRLPFIEAQGMSSELAEDILQHSLLKAIGASPDLRDADRLISWFYRIVRNVVPDDRRCLTERKALFACARKQVAETATHQTAWISLCFRRLLPFLKPEYRLVIEEIEPDRRAPADIALLLGITRNNLNVLRHRARQQLRRQLEDLCIDCPSDVFSDCECSLVRPHSFPLAMPDAFPRLHHRHESM